MALEAPDTSALKQRTSIWLRSRASSCRSVNDQTRVTVQQFDDDLANATVPYVFIRSNADMKTGTRQILIDLAAVLSALDNDDHGKGTGGSERRLGHRFADSAAGYRQSALLSEASRRPRAQYRQGPLRW